MFKSKGTHFLTADCLKVVEEGAEDAAFLIVREGSPIMPEIASHFGIKTEKVNKDFGAFAPPASTHPFAEYFPQPIPNYVPGGLRQMELAVWNIQAKAQAKVVKETAKAKAAEEAKPPTNSVTKTIKADDTPNITPPPPGDTPAANPGDTEGKAKTEQAQIEPGKKD